ncbi:MAG: hypothetical protein A2X32_04260 [Elusimicrobia bacterium GWC2_64_44]|nr:MAG: hypothetical protein A2X32_04260 [Elusimicrobia bacterium GWC2_64_44]
MIDLKPIFLKKVKKILAGNVPEYEVLVYGARAGSKGKTYSYLDLAIMTDKPLAAARLEKLTAAFQAADLPFRVETVDWAGTGPGFRKEIKKTAVVLQPTPKA